MAKADNYRAEQPTVAHDVPAPVAARPSRKPFILEQVQGPGAPREFVLDLPELVVGRSLQAHVSIDAGGVSRKHLALRRAGVEYVCTDLDSANGVYLNGVKTHSATLRQGDTIQMGDVVFVYHEGT